MSDFKVFVEWISLPRFVVESWNQFNPHKGGIPSRSANRTRSRRGRREII